MIQILNLYGENFILLNENLLLNIRLFPKSESFSSDLYFKVRSLTKNKPSNILSVF